MNDVLTLVINGFVQRLLFVAATLLTAHFVRRRVTVRHSVLLSGLVGLALLPLFVFASAAVRPNHGQTSLSSPSRLCVMTYNELMPCPAR